MQFHEDGIEGIPLEDVLGDNINNRTARISKRALTFTRVEEKACDCHGLLLGQGRWETHLLLVARIVCRNALVLVTRPILRERSSKV